MKNDAAIDNFVKWVLAVDLPIAVFRAESHPLSHGVEQFDDGFDRSLLGLDRNSPLQCIEVVRFPSPVVDGLFEC